MKILLASALCCGLVCTIYSCSNNAAASSPASGKQSSTDPDQVADGKWSATIDGQSITGEGTDEPLQQQNAAYVLPDDDPGNSKPIEITDGKFDMPMATSKVHPE